MSESKKKVAIITGASSGFGKATAIKLVEQGWFVVILARRLEKLEKLVDILGEANCLMRVFDVCNDQHISLLTEALAKQKLMVDLLVNNAGLALGLESADKASMDNWQTMVDTNISGLMKMTRAILPMMVHQGKGHIINIGSIAGTYPYPGGNAYGATKAFVAQFSLNLRADLAGTGIRVTNIEPGLAETEFSVVRFAGDQAKADSIYQGVEPLTAEDVAEAIVWSTNQPAHVNINRIELMPTCQAFAPLSISK